MKINRTVRSLTAPSLLLAASMMLSGCVIHVGGDSDGRGVSSVFGHLEVSEGKHVGNVSSVNGGITLEDGVSASHVDTVNGSIEIGRNVQVDFANTVNGDIETGRGFVSNGSVETVNGDIEIDEQSEVFGDVETVNGDIDLKNVMVHSDLSTVNGDITLKDETHIKGDITFHKRSKSTDRYLDYPVLKIERGVTVEGEIILESPIELEIEDAELLKKVRENYSNK